MSLAKFAARQAVQAVQRHLVLNDVGLMMGVTILAKRGGDELRLDEKRVMTLLSVAHGRVPAQKTLNYIRNAEKHYQQGDALMCSMALALTGVHGFTQIEQAHELFAAEEFLNTGGTELELLKHCGIERVLDDPNALALYKMLAKENPYHKPAGSPNSTGGQFTDAKGASGGGAIDPRPDLPVDNESASSDLIGGIVIPAIGAFAAMETIGIEGVAAVGTRIRSLFSGGEVAEASLTVEENTAAQAENLARFESKLPAKAKPTKITQLPDGGKIFQADVPANNIPGSFARYEKTIDSMGNTVRYTKTTYAPDGSIVHLKIK
ncbi:MAG TPA: hypothetical protein VFT64_04450 [Rickettsiales bacterium]|nr:hypothetical protein [Rickettsiales bacterium]